MQQRLDSLLLRLEETMRTDVRYLIRGGFWSLLNFLMTVGFGVVTMVALANFLPKEILGTYQFILSVAGILAVSTLSGVGTAITRAVARGDDGSLRAGLRLKFKWSITIVMGSGLIALYYFLNGDTTLATAFLIVGVSLPFIESYRLYENYLRGKEAFKDGVTLGFWRKPIPLVAVIAAAYFSDDVLVLITAYFTSHAISYGLVYFQTTSKYKPEKASENITEVFSLSKHLSFVTILSQLTSNLDKILIWHFLGPVAVAGFSVAQITTRYASGVLNSMTVIALPKVSKRDFSTLQKTLPRKVFSFSLLLLFGALAYAAVIPVVFKYVFPEYPESVIISQLLAALFVLAPSKIFSQALIAHGHMKSQYLISFLSPLVFGVSLLLLTPAYGIIGAAFSVVLVSVVVALMNFLLFVKPFPTKSSSVGDH